MTDKKYDNLTVLRPMLHDLGLMSETDFERITQSTAGTRESWRKSRKGFPSIRIGNNYFYPLDLAKKHIEELITKKYPEGITSDDII